MKALALGCLLCSAVALGRELPSSRRLFIGTSAEVGTHATGGFGLALDLGQQVSNRFAWYVSMRGTTRLTQHETFGLLIAELSVAEHWSVATGAGTRAVFWAGAPDRGFFGLAVPLRVSWDYTSVDTRPWATLRVSLEGGAAPVGFGRDAPLFWGSVLIGSVWR